MNSDQKYKVKNTILYNKICEKNKIYSQINSYKQNKNLKRLQSVFWTTPKYFKIFKRYVWKNILQLMIFKGKNLDDNSWIN